MTRWKTYPNYKDSGIVWLGDVPDHWEAVRLRFRAETNPSRSEVNGSPSTLDVSFVPMESVHEYGGLTLDQTRPLAEVATGYTYFRDGDILTAKITPCFENGKGSIAADLVNGLGFGTTELHVLRPHPELDGRFLFYVTISHAFRNLGAAEMYGAGGQKRVPEDFIKDFRQPCSSLDEQRAIAAFLDRETTRIDGLIEKKQRQIELLQEKRAALISHAVTKGLNPNVKMKPSGIEWLGDIPAHWERKRLKHVTSHIVDCIHATPDYIEDGAYPAIRTADVSPGRLDLGNARRVGEEVFNRQISRLKPRAMDIVYSREGERFGMAALVPPGREICISQRMMLFRVSSKVVVPDFLMWQLNASTVYRQAEQDVNGATSPHVNVETIRNFWLAVPPIQEQRAIANTISFGAQHADKTSERIQKSIERLREYRTALISATVTGKIDVRKEGI